MKLELVFSLIIVIVVFVLELIVDNYFRGWSVLTFAIIALVVGLVCFILFLVQNIRHKTEINKLNKE
ncbi:MAG: hypothetical protein Q4D99_02990 [Bacillota bacterium]|nr:hypothetical protein [Bacillota bacterium]